MQQVINFIYAAVLAGTPLLFGTLGEILTEKVGNLNLGVEGMMFMGAAVGFACGYYTDSALLAVLGGFAAGALGGLIYAFLTVTLKANQNVTGLTLTIFGVGFGNMLGDYIMRHSPGNAAFVSEKVKAAFAKLNVPGISDLPFAGKLFFQYNVLVYLAIAIAILMYIFLQKTQAGLNLRAVGENPAAADAVSVPVTRYKYLAICVGGGISGLGGVYVSMTTTGGTWVYNCVNGLGWIAVALVIFAAWSPAKAIVGSYVFGGLSVLRHYVVLKIPVAIYAMLPFAATIVVLLVTSVRQSREKLQPKGCGINYDREER